MLKNENASNRMFRSLAWLMLLAALVYLVVRHLGVVGNIVMVMLGFGAVVLIHEFGHFIIAKLSGIKVEAFSLFMPPTLVGLQRTAAGIRVRFFPAFSSKEEEPPEQEDKGFVLGKRGKASDTEYRLGLIPFGGYVKLLGQDDVGPVRQNSDPRSFANKPVRVRIPVIAAGVTFNAISAAIIFMVVFLIGIRLPPPVVGEVEPNSPAAKAGLKSGDEIVVIDGQSDDLDFSNIQLSAALSGRDERVPMTVRRRDGSEEQIFMVAQKSPDSPIKRFGIAPAASLTIAKLVPPDAAILKKQMGLEPGDQIVAVDGKPVERYWQFADALKRVWTLKIPVTVRRGTELVPAELPREVAPLAGQSESDLSNVYSMVPRLQIASVLSPPPPSLGQKVLRALRLGGMSGRQEDVNNAAKLQPGDIILAIGAVEDPTYEELRKITSESENKPLQIDLLRADSNGLERSVTVTVTPRRDPAGGKRVLIGFVPALDTAHPVVADTVSTPGGPPKLDIPRGARITAVNGQPVANYYDIIREIRRADAQPVALEYRKDGTAEGGVTLPPSVAQMPVRFDSQTADLVPFQPLERLYQARSVPHALTMGYRRTVMFIAQTYVTLQRLLSGLLSPKLLMGPVGIMVASYQIVSEQSTVYYAYFLGLISASIAVLNLLPMPPFDGGLIVLMLIEKVKGSALSEKTQSVLATTGWVLVLALLLYVTVFADLVRVFSSQT
jgi:regulator of sigma E protease